MKASEAYKQGFIDGLRAFAHWKDGMHWVGTTGTTLHEAILRVEKLAGFQPPKETSDEG